MAVSLPLDCHFVLVEIGSVWVCLLIHVPSPLELSAFYGISLATSQQVGFDLIGVLIRSTLFVTVGACGFLV